MRRQALGTLSLTAAMLCATVSRGEEPPRPAPPSPSGSAVSSATPGTHLTVDKEVIDLGQITRGSKAEASFVVRNTGATPIKILSAKPG